MKILFLAENYKNWVASTLYYEQKAIQNILPGSVFYGPGYQCRNSYVPEIMSEIYGFSKPDVIFCYINEKQLLNKPMSNEISSRYDIPESLKVFPTGLHKVTVPKIAWINDFWHCTRQEWDRILIENGFEMAFATYCPPFIKRDIFNRFFSKKVQEKIIFVPWPRAVATDTFTDYKLKKIYDLVLLGAMDENFYPLRLKMHNAFSKLKNIQYYHKSHPGYRFCGNNDLVGSKYAELINQSRIFASCTGKYNIPFIKIYEALACGSLLMCDRPQGAEYLGLKEKVNYLPVKENNFVEIALDYLAKPETCDEISRNGHDLIAKRHTVEIRAKQFVEVIDCILNNNRAIDWVELSPNRKQLTKKKSVLKIKNDKSIKIMDNKNQSKMQCRKNTIFNNAIHITDLVKHIDKNTYDIWYKYGANYRVDEEPPVVTKYPELVMLRGLYLKEMARKIKAQTIVEVGTARGFQSFMWARYLLESQYYQGKIITCDIVGMKERIFKTPITGQKYFTREELWKNTLEAKHVTFVQGDSLKMAKLINRELDLLYIDGEHTESAVIYDLKNLSPFFHKKSIIVFDDCDERFPGIQKAVYEISSDLGLKPQIISFTPSRYKIAIVELEQNHQELIHNANILSNNTLSNYDEKIELCEVYDREYGRWFKKICIPSVLKMSENDPIMWQGSSLAWDACHEIMAYHVFTDRKIPIETLLYLSNNRYKLLEEFWPIGNLTKKLVDDFYIKSAEILPWGHGVFIADHNVQERRNTWKRRIEILKMILNLGLDSICDYGAGGGHTTLLAKTMGFKRIVHHEYSVFHPYVKWRSDNIGNFGDSTQEFEMSRAEDGLKLSKSVDVVLCMDVAEHVWDTRVMLQEISNSLKPNGYLIWNSVFGEGISCHLHPELKGKEDELLNDFGFHRVEDLKVKYIGHSGLYKKKVKHKEKIVSNRSEIIKPTVLFIVDKPNWAHDYKTLNLQKQLSNDYVIEKVYCDNIRVDDIEHADLVVIYYWEQFLNDKIQKLHSVIKKNKHKLLFGICSHIEMSGNNRKFGLEVLKEYASAIFVNNRSLFEEFSAFFDVPVFYTPNGVDTTFFKPSNLKHKSTDLRVGWAGSLKNHGDKRGYHEFISAAVESVAGVELVTAAREEVWRTHQQMLEFYNSIDVYICASRTEGTPNPCLEAAACGLPLLTTNVGNMPELIENGVNGLLIRRDVDDIVNKLNLLRDNPGLRTQLSKKAREHILNWDWQKKAQNYKHMFEAVLTAKSQRNSLFHSSEQVYLASADKIDSVLKNCQQFNNVPNRHINSYVSVIGGMSGLNYLSMMAPQTITFFDVNYCAVEYLKCLLEIIDISKGCRDFISRVFSRSIDMFLNANSYDELTVDNQHQYLDMKFDQNIYSELMSILTPFSQRIYKKYLEPYLSCRLLSGVRNCRQLVPCYPINERVPVGGGEESGWNEYGELVPNLNTFFYGHGWLSSDNVFNHVKTILKTAKIQLMVFNLFQDELDLLANFSGHVTIHCSNIDDWFSEKWAKWSQKALQKSLRKRGDLTLITTNGGVKHSFFDPHIKALESIKPYVYGKIVEVTHKIPWGFHEFERDTIVCYDYINGICPISDTTIIHNLAGEGISHHILEKVIRIAVQKSTRIIILEHNQKSSDWDDNSNSRSFMTISQLTDKLNKIIMPLNAYIHPAIKIPGHSDLSRNIMFVIDTVNSYNLEKCKNYGTVRKRISDATRNQFFKSNNELSNKGSIPDAHFDVLFSNHETRQRATERFSGFSFCVITAGKRPEKLTRLIKSIHDQHIHAYEIIVAGVTSLREDILYVPMPEAAQSGKIAVLRNAAAEKSRYNHLVFVDDDIVFLKGWYLGLKPYVEKYDLLSTKFLNLDGTRFWDWSTTGGPRGHVMLDYDEFDEHIYLTGGLLVTTAKVWDTIRWDDQLGINQFEDVDFSRRAKAAGFKFCCCKDSVAVHDDSRYTQVGRRVYVRKDAGIRTWLYNELAQSKPSELLDRAATNLKEGLIAEAADCIRYCLRVNADSEVVKNVWQSFVKQIDFPAQDDGNWRPYPILDVDSKSTDQHEYIKNVRFADSGIKSKIDLNRKSNSFESNVSNPSSTSSIPAILWHAPIFDPSGYADEARNLILQLQRQNIKPAVREMGRRSDVFRNGLCTQKRVQLDEAIAKETLKDFISIIQFPAYAFERIPKARYHIGRTTFETDGLPADWVQKCNLMDEIWVPSEFNMQTFKAAGVTSKLFKVPEGVESERFRPGLDALKIPGTRGVVFLSIFEWIYRKGWDVLLKSWAKAFGPGDDVSLVLRTYSLNATDCDEAKQKIEGRINHFLKSELKISRQEVAPIIVLTDQLHEQDMPRLYAAADAYVLPSRGEGWGRTQMEAMACGLPVLTTRWGGNLEFMNDHNSLLIGINGLAVIDERAEIAFYRGQKWAEPSVEHLGELMRKIVENLTEVRKIGRRARLDIERYWGWERIAAIAVKRLRAINTEIEHHSVTTCGSNAVHRVIWEGSQFVNHSLALVNRELCIELAKRKDIELSLIPYEPDEFGVGEDPARFGLIAERLRKPLSGAVHFHVRHQWPPNFSPPPEGHWIIIQPWEFGALPKDWVEPMKTQVDELWVPSNHVRDVYINSGISPDNVFVVPNGVNYDQFHPHTPKLKLATTKRFKFLFVGGTIMRKGIDILLDAFTTVFSNKDDVCLVIKDMGGESFYRGQNASQMIEDIKKNPASPEILYITGTLKHEEIAGLYTACNCLVHPYRGEGFGLPVAEAMACGLPVIVTKGGACDDFCTAEYAYLIDSTVRPVHSNNYVLSAPAWLLEPDKSQLIEMLKFVYKHPNKTREKGTIAARQIRKMVDWKMSTDQIMARLKALKDKPVRRFANSADSQAVQDMTSPRKIYQSIQQSMKNKRPEEVIHELEMLAESYPQFALAHNDLGVLYYQVGNKENAHQFYEKAVQLDRENMVFQKNLADFYYVEMGRVKDALRIYVKILESNPEDIETLLITGYICIALEKFQDAKVFYSRVLEIEPGHQDALQFINQLKLIEKGKFGAKTPEEHYKEVQPLLTNSDPHRAIGLLERLLEKFPDFALAHNDLGVIYYQTDNKEKAQHHYERAVEMMPENINFQKNLADFYCFELARIEEALKIYVNILVTYPQDVETLLATGQICVALEKPGDARDFFNRVLEIEPWNEIARQHLKELERPSSPVIFFDSESPEEIYQNLQSVLSNMSSNGVIRHLRKLMESFPDFALAYNDLGVLYYNDGDKEKALNHYQKAVQLEPANATFQKNLADYYLVELDRKEEALQIYLSLLEHHPNDLETNLTAAHICVAAQNFSKAKELYKQVLVIDPGNEDARNNLCTLGKIKGDLRTGQPPKTESPQKSTSEKYSLATETIRVNDASEKDTPQFSIIMPTSAPLKQFRRCADSIKEHISDSYEILFVNNGTTKGVLKWVRQCIDENHNWHLVKCGKGANPAVCYNTGIKAARGEYIVLLSNDVVVTECWLPSMLQCFNSIPDAGMVGTMANRARGRQKVPAAVNTSFTVINTFAESYRATNRHRRIECDILDGFCLLFRRDLTEKIGLFDEQMGALGFEDEDYCLRAALEGYVNQIAGDVYLHRLERKAPDRSKKHFNLKWSGADVQGSTGKRHLALRAVEKANRAAEEGKIDLAVELFLQAIGLLPEHKENYYQLAEMLVNTKGFKDALDVLNELPEGDPDARYLELAACCKEGLEHFEEAEGYANRALEISRCDPSALNTKGIIAFRRDDKNAAESYFARAMEADPGFGEAYTNLGALKWVAGLKDEALSLYERGFILSPTVPDIALNYHCALADLGEYQRAESVVRDAAAVHPRNKKIRYMLIDILLHQQNHEMAMQEIEKAIADFGVDEGILSSALKIREKIGPLTIDRKTGSGKTVSLCMIVKDEEEHLARCLQSVRPVVDEIIVVDTGSRDRSRDVARAFGAKVFDFEWTEDFAEARNYSLSKATGKMVFVMDADEVISPLDYELFRRIARQSSRQRSAFTINTRNYTMDNNLVEWVANEGYYDIEEAGTGWTPSAKIRLFPNDLHIRFDFPVHEMVEPSLQKMGITVKFCNFQVHHYGKLNRDKSEKKGEAYYEIGCKKLEEMGDSPIALRELAIQAEGLKKHEEAVALWERFIAIVPNEPKAYINMGISNCNLGQFDKVLASAEKALKLAPDLKEGHFNCALANLHLGHPDQTIEILEKLCQKMPEYLPARFILAAACCCREDKKRGIALLKELSGTAIGPGLAIRCHELASRFVLLQRPAYALALLDAAIDSQNANKDVLDLYADCLNLTEFHKKTGTYDL